MKIKTSELSGVQLDWAVCKARGEHQHPYDEYTPTWMANRRYSEDWAKGGPIIEREGISVLVEDDAWKASNSWGHIPLEGPTPLVAAMRCFVASKLGKEVEVPDAIA
jgi:hypothetical protein